MSEITATEKGNGKNGNGRLGYRKIGQRYSAAKNNRVGKKGNTKLLLSEIIN